jgi:transcriptional regulator with XRE-family HTH domain
MKERIEKIIETEQLSASKFADALGVQRSNISHILNGRNKPSLELVNKILDRFPAINADWLLLGKGDMVSEKKSGNTSKNSGYTFESNPSQPEQVSSAPSGQPMPVRIVVFYADNTFEEFRPR